MKAWMRAATWVALAWNIELIWLTLWPWNEANRSIARWRTTAFLPRRTWFEEVSRLRVAQFTDEELGPAGHRHLLRLGRLDLGVRVRLPTEHL